MRKESGPKQEQQGTPNFGAKLRTFAKAHKQLREEGYLDVVAELYKKHSPNRPINEANVWSWVQDVALDENMKPSEETRLLDVMNGILETTAAQETYGDKLLKKMNKLKAEHPHLNRDGNVDDVITLLQKHPYTHADSFGVGEYLDEAIEQGLLEDSAYNRVMDTLLTEIV